MPRDGAGVYTLPVGNPVVTNTVIASTWANSTMSDIAAQLNNVLTRDGLLGPTGPFKLQDGTVAAPGLAWASEPGLGWYRVGASQIGFAAAGQQTSYVDASTFHTTVGYYPRAASYSSSITVWNKTAAAADGSFLQIAMQADNIARIYSGAIGTAVRGNLFLDAPITKIGGGSGGSSNLILNKTVATQGNNFFGTFNDLRRWALVMGNNEPETGSNIGSNFQIIGYDDAGNSIGSWLTINRSTGLVAINNGLQLNGGGTFNGTCTFSASVVANITGTAANSNALGGTAPSGWTLSDWITTVGLVGNNELQPYIRQASTTNLLKLVRNGGDVAKLIRDGASINFYAENGGFIGGVVTSGSDERMKENITPLESDSAAYLRIAPIHYTWRDKFAGSNTGVQDGFSAQNVAAEMPGALIGGFDKADDEGRPVYAGLNDRAILAHTVAQVQKLMQRITQLENQ